MSEDYKVGYKTPPKPTQFKKGKSGNPGGRPKGTSNKKNNQIPLKTSYDFEKLIVEVGYEDINVSQEGEVISVSKLEALLMQIYNKAMKGNLGAAKLLLEYTQNSIIDTERAAHRAYQTTKRMRDQEREKIFILPPKPNTYGSTLKSKHALYSHIFTIREIFGPDQFEKINEDQPDNEYDWARFNSDMSEEYKHLGDLNISSNHSDFEHSIFKL